MPVDDVPQSADQSKAWWSSLPAVITAFAALLTASVGAVVALHGQLQAAKASKEVFIGSRQTDMDSKLPLATCKANILGAVNQLGGKIRTNDDDYVTFSVNGSGVIALCPTKEQQGDITAASTDENEVERLVYATYSKVFE